MAELLAEVDGGEAWHAPWTELHASLVERWLLVDLLWTDTPYSARTHRGHDDGAQTANRAKDWSSRLDDQPLHGNAKAIAKYAAEGKGERRRINYAAWTPRDVREFVAAWAPITRGWFVTITDDVLAPWWSAALRRAGRYVFAPIPYVAPGSRVRMVGDGPPLWGNWMIFARPRGGGFSKWGTSAARAARGDAPALPGAYVAPDEEGLLLLDRPPQRTTLEAPMGAYVLPPGEGGKLEVVGGKPDWLHRQVVEGYSARGGLVVDPCAGGGGAGRAALQLGRRAILGDALREHAELCGAALREGARRRDQAKAYLPPPARAEQRTLW